MAALSELMQNHPLADVAVAAQVCDRFLVRVVGQLSLLARCQVF